MGQIFEKDNVSKRSNPCAQMCLWNVYESRFVEDIIPKQVIIIILLNLNSDVILRALILIKKSVMDYFIKYDFNHKQFLWYPLFASYMIKTFSINI